MTKNNDFMRSMDLRIKSEDDRKGETGRSMVEMLGTLAIIGVLSVGSIAGYTYAMNKYYANELLAGASERAVLVAAQIASGRTPNLNEFANYTVPNGTFGEVKTDIEYGFGIVVSGVKDAVCENLIKSTEGMDVSIANDDKTLSDVTCSGDNNAFMFVFDYGVGGGGENGGESCGESDVEKCSGGQYYTCDDGKWVAHDLPTGTTCNGEEMGCTDGAERCLNGQSQKCTDGRWTDFWGIWGCCDGNRLVPLDTNACVNGLYVRCTSGRFVETQNNSACCNGDVVVHYGHVICEDGKSIVCNGSSLSIAGYGCCENPTPDGRRCFNGQAQWCSAGAWMDSFDFCCDGDTVTDCSESCANHGHGIWCGSYCSCDEGWSGADCSVKDICSGHGIWYYTGCICDSGWCGSDCSVKL